MRFINQLVLGRNNSTIFNNARFISSTKLTSSSTSSSILTQKYSLPEAMETISLLRSTPRTFINQEIPPATLKRILKLSATSPSSFNLQPFRLLVVQGEQEREALASCMLGANKESVLKAPINIVIVHFKNPYRLVDRLVSLESKHGASKFYISTLPLKLNFLLAPSIITHKLKRLGSHLASPFRPTPVIDESPSIWAKKNSFLLIQQLLLSASSYGVSSLPMEGYDEQRVCSLYDMNQDEFSAALIVSLGYANDNKEERDEIEKIAKNYEDNEENIIKDYNLIKKKRYDLNQVIFYNNFNTSYPF